MSTQPVRSMTILLAGVLLTALSTWSAAAQDTPSFRALNIPRAAPTNDSPYQPQPILQGGIVVPLYPPDSPQLNLARVREAEYYNLSKAVPGRISWITNIH